MTRRPGRAAWEDLRALAELKGAPFPTAAGLVDVLLLPASWCVLFLRAASALERSGLGPVATLVRFANLAVFGADIDPRAEIGPGLVVAHPPGVTIGQATLGSRVSLMGSVRVGGAASGRPGSAHAAAVGDGCFLMAGVKVLAGTVGAGVVLGTGAVVVGDIAPGTIAFGDPARVIRRRHRDPEVKRFGEAGATEPRAAT